MSESHLSTANYAAVIADLRAKRDELDRTIAMLEAMVKLSQPTQADNASRQPSDDSRKQSAQTLAQNPPTRASRRVGAINTGIGDAVAQVLMEQSRPLTTREVTDALAKTGFPLNMANPLNNVWSALDHRSKIRGDVIREGKAWRWNRPQDKGGLTTSLSSLNGMHTTSAVE
jgi:hypothetical protein